MMAQGIQERLQASKLNFDRVRVGVDLPGPKCIHCPCGI